MAKQYYEFKDKTSSKFWEIDAKGKTVTVRFGKIATDCRVSSDPSLLEDGQRKAPMA